MHSSSDTWRVLVFHVTSEERQQEVLRAFRDITDLDIVALGSRNREGVHVVVDCPTPVAQVVAQGVVATIDPASSMNYISNLRTVPTA